MKIFPKMALETFGSHPLAVVWLQQWFEQLLKFQKTIRVVLPVCILLMITLPCVHSYDSSLNLSPKCKLHCDNYRNPGRKDEYVFDCTYAHHWRESKLIKDCSEQCKHCPDFVCDSHNPHIFKCPATKVEGTCETFCDEHREGNLDGYIIDCNKKFIFKRDITHCKDVCSQCPYWVCDGSDNVLYCPEVKYDDKCKERCEYFRTELTSTTKNTFEFSCLDISKSPPKKKCMDYCDDCAEPVCHEDDVVYVNEKTKYWTCPSSWGPSALYGPKPRPKTRNTKPKPPPAYEGPCKERCDKFRTGGTDKYRLDCNSLFEPHSADLKECVSDCNRCPEDVCPSSDGKNSFYCPKSEDHVDDVPELPDPKFTIAVVFAVIMTILFVIALCAYFLLRRRLRQVVAVANRGAEISNQPSQHQQMPQTSTYSPALHAADETRKNSNASSTSSGDIGIDQPEAQRSTRTSNPNPELLESTSQFPPSSATDN